MSVDGIGKIEEGFCCKRVIMGRFKRQNIKKAINLKSPNIGKIAQNKIQVCGN